LTATIIKKTSANWNTAVIKAVIGKAKTMAATSSTTSIPKRSTSKRIVIKKLPQTLHELVSNAASKQPSKRFHKTEEPEIQSNFNSNSNSNTSATMLLNNIANSDFTYNANAVGSGNVRRIRTPAPHDVLSGRGGSVNAHPGNCQFRDWVHVRKEEYNLARSKQAKADICREIISKVTALGGRFLTKESPSSQWWIEQDDERMMSKTSQALREGAPKIREAHRDELNLTGNASRRKSQATNTFKSGTTGAQPQTLKRPMPSQHTGGKRVRVDYKGQTVFPNQSTPPLISTPEPQTALSSSDFQIIPATTSIQRPFQFPPPLRSNISATQSTGYRRSNSLATSDIVNIDENYEFVNPFEDESYLFENPNSMLDQPIGSSKVLPNHIGNERNLSDSASSKDSSVMGITTELKSGLLRESSVSSTMTDFAGFGALLGGINSNSNNNFNESFRSINSMGNISIQSDTNNTTTAHIVPLRCTSIGSVSTAGKEDTERCNEYDDEEDNRSAVTEATTGTPLWDWFNRDVNATLVVPLATTPDAPTATALVVEQQHPIPIA
jgi:hypothetical protein